MAVFVVEAVVIWLVFVHFLWLRLEVDMCLLLVLFLPFVRVVVSLVCVGLSLIVNASVDSLKCGVCLVFWPCLFTTGYVDGCSELRYGC